VLVQLEQTVPVDTSDLQTFVRVFLEQVSLVEQNYIKMFTRYEKDY